jgi:hypothetical protein
MGRLAPQAPSRTKSGTSRPSIHDKIPAASSDPSHLHGDLRMAAAASCHTSWDWRRGSDPDCVKAPLTPSVPVHTSESYSSGLKKRGMYLGNWRFCTCRYPTPSPERLPPVATMECPACLLPGFERVRSAPRSLPCFDPTRLPRVGIQQQEGTSSRFPGTDTCVGQVCGRETPTTAVAPMAVVDRTTTRSKRRDG